MCDVGNIILNSVLTFASVWIVRKFLDTFYEKKRWNVLSVSVWLIYIIFQGYVQFHSGDASVVTTIVNVLLCIMISAISYYGFGKNNIFLLTFFWAVWALVEMIIFFFLNLFCLEQRDFNMIGSIISKIIMLIGTYILSFVWKKRENSLIPVKYYIVFFFVSIGSIYIAVAVFFSENNTVTAMIVFSILLLFNMIILEVYSKITEKIMLEKEKTVYEQQIHMMTNNTKEQKKLMEDFHRERHDLINKLIVLKNEIEQGEKENVIREIDKIIENNHTESYISDSGNQVIDALLNTKYSIAKENGIQFLLKIFIPEELPINQCDLGVVLGNALDNAIEATEKCNENNKNIEIAMGIKKQSLVFVIKNPYEGSLKQDKTGKLISTKNDFRRHGYGISSIQKVADKYGGDVIIETQDGKFILTVMMNIGDF